MQSYHLSLKVIFPFDKSALEHLSEQELSSVCTLACMTRGCLLFAYTLEIVRRRFQG